MQSEFKVQVFNVHNNNQNATTVSMNALEDITKSISQAAAVQLNSNDFLMTLIAAKTNNSYLIKLASLPIIYSEVNLLGNLWLLRYFIFLSLNHHSFNKITLVSFTLIGTLSEISRPWKQLKSIYRKYLLLTQNSSLPYKISKMIPETVNWGSALG